VFRQENVSNDGPFRLSLFIGDFAKAWNVHIGFFLPAVDEVAIDAEALRQGLRCTTSANAGRAINDSQATVK
jgi:hypothetical protein